MVYLTHDDATIPKFGIAGTASIYNLNVESNQSSSHFVAFEDGPTENNFSTIVTGWQVSNNFTYISVLSFIYIYSYIFCLANNVLFISFDILLGLSLFVW